MRVGVELAVFPPGQRQAAAPTSRRLPRSTSAAGGYADDGRARYLQAIDGMTVRRQPRAGPHARAQLLSRGAGHRAHGAAGLANPELRRGDRARQWRRRCRPGRAAGAAEGRHHARRGDPERRQARPTAAPKSAASTAWPPRTSPGRCRNAAGADPAGELTLVTGPGGRIYWLQYAAKDAAARQRAAAGGWPRPSRRSAR